MGRRYSEKLKENQAPQAIEAINKLQVYFNICFKLKPKGSLPFIYNLIVSMLNPYILYLFKDDDDKGQRLYPAATVCWLIQVKFAHNVPACVGVEVFRNHSTVTVLNNIPPSLHLSSPPTLCYFFSFLFLVTSTARIYRKYAVRSTT